MLGLNNCQPGKLNFTQVATAHCKSKNYTTRISKLFAEKGIEGVLRIERNSASDVANLKLDSKMESHLIAMACTPPPSPYARWTVDLCTSELNRRMNTNFAKSTVWRALKRNKLHPHLSEYWCIPEITEEYILRMERVHHIYGMPYDKAYPVVCLNRLQGRTGLDDSQRCEETAQNSSACAFCGFSVYAFMPIPPARNAKFSLQTYPHWY